MVVSAQVQWTH